MNNTLHQPGYRIHEYGLVIPLPEALQAKITALRKSLYEKHGVPLTADIKPALTVLKGFAYERLEQRLTDRLQETVMGLHPFPITLQGFVAHGSQHIGIGLDAHPVAEVVKELKQTRWLMAVPQAEPQYFAQPQLLLAQNLKPMKFISMWMDCEHRQFNGRFVADALLLLRRSPISNRFEVVRRLEAMSRGMAVKQGELFA